MRSKEFYQYTLGKFRRTTGHDHHYTPGNIKESLHKALEISLSGSRLKLG